MRPVSDQNDMPIVRDKRRMDWLSIVEVLLGILQGLWVFLCSLGGLVSIVSLRDNERENFFHGASLPPMGFNSQRGLRVGIKKVKMKEKMPLCYGYMFQGEQRPVGKSFDIILPRLHGLLFDELVITISRAGKDGSPGSLMGVAKLRLKQFMTSPLPGKQKCDVWGPSYLETADAYDKEAEAIGRVHLRFKLLENIEGAEPVGTPGKRSLLSYIVGDDRMESFRLIYDILHPFRRGSFFSRLSWVVRLVSADYYYTNYYGDCRIDHSADKSAVCVSQFCHTTYGLLPEDEIRDAIRTLQYAIASFGNSIVTWRISRLRKRPDVKGARMRAILERSGVEEADIAADVEGNDKTLAHVAFFTETELVVSFKGTTNLSEVITDLSCDYVEFQDGYAHRGIRNLADNWMIHHWESLKEKAKNRGMKRILLTGHSLGGGASIMVYLRMRDMGLESTWDIRVVAFGPPPVVSRDIAKRPMPRIRVFCYGSDIISRLCFGSALDLKYICQSIRWPHHLFTRSAEIIEEVAEIKKQLTDANLYPKLYLPGEIIHIRDFSSVGVQEVMYKRVECDFFEEIVCSRGAFLDHLVQKTVNAFRKTLSKYEELSKRGELG